MSQLLLFSTERYAQLSARVAEHGRFDEGAIERKIFPDGERYRRISTNCIGRDVALLGGTVDDHDMLEIYDLASGLVEQGAHTLTLVLPWFGYQTMERASCDGEIVAAKTRARLLSSIPAAGSGNRVVMIDLHTEGITQYFSGDIRPVHLSAKSVILDAIQALGKGNYVIGAADAGRAQWVESLANDLGVDAAFIFKRRLSGDQTELTAMAADVKDKNVVIYDDMIRTGGSLISAAQAFIDAGAADISAVCTHGVLPGDAFEKLKRSGVLKSLICTDTRPRVESLRADDFVDIVSVAPLIAEHLRRRLG